MERLTDDNGDIRGESEFWSDLLELGSKRNLDERNMLKARVILVKNRHVKFVDDFVDKNGCVRELVHGIQPTHDWRRDF